ncbi:hypothetical protein LJR296_007465 [Cupriavidus necator]|uniref:hypothetical protein n=1 Tax=Cupriavidus necator TaxID=106590 RepID=UPI003ECF1ED3
MTILNANILQARAACALALVLCALPAPPARAFQISADNAWQCAAPTSSTGSATACRVWVATFPRWISLKSVKKTLIHDGGTPFYHYAHEPVSADSGSDTQQFAALTCWRKICAEPAPAAARSTADACAEG